MRKNSVSTIPFVVSIALALMGAWQAAGDGNPPERMTYQGYLVDGNGVALGDSAPKNYDVVFRIWSDQSSTDTSKRLWSELQTVTVDKGYFSALLGEGTDPGEGVHGLLSNIFTNKTDASDRWIEMTVKGIGNPDLRILPRLRLLTSPYAFLARNAVNAANLVNSGYNQVVTVSGTSVGINKLSPTTPLDVNGTVTATTFAGSGASLTSLNANNITTGTLSDARLSSNVPLLNGSPNFTGLPKFSGGLTLGSGATMTFLGANALRLTDGPIYLRGTTDNNHGLVYSNWIDGPCLFGYVGGTLNTTYGGAKSVLNWNRFGNVGIGSTSPQARLELQAGADSGGGNDQKAIALAFRSGGYRHWIRTRHNAVTSGTGNSIDFFLNTSATADGSSAPGTGSTLTLTLDNTRVGIGTNTPQEKLHVNGSALIEGQLKVKSTSGGGTLVTGNNLNDNRIYLEGYSNNMLSNATAIHITGRSDVPIPNFVVKADRYYLLGLTDIGDHKNVQWDSTTGELGYDTSSRRFKENIRPLEADWLKLLSAQAVTYTRPGRPDRWEIGFIAEDFDEMGLQPLTEYDPYGQPNGINYEKISVYLLQIAKAQQADLKEKSSRIEGLEQSVAELKTLVNALADKVNGGGR